MKKLIMLKFHWIACLTISLSLLLVFAATAASEDNPDEVVAILNGKPIYRSEIEQTIAFKLYRLQGSIYRLIQRETNAVVDQRLLETQAARQGLSIAGLLEKEVKAKVKPPTEQEISEYLAKHPKGGSDAQQRRNRARTFLHQRSLQQRRLDYLASLRAAADFTFVLVQPRMPRIKIEVTHQPWRGEAQAPITLVHFADLTSTLTHQSAQKIEKAMKAFSGKIKWVHWSFLNRMDEDALAAALAGEQAHDQGKFWAFHDAILKLNGDVDLEAIERIAANLKLNTKFLNNVELKEHSLLNIKSDIRAAKRIGVSAAPVIFVNGIYFSGTFSYEQLEKEIQAELVRTGESVKGLKTDLAPNIQKK